jgi:hypothetical protein
MASVIDTMKSLFQTASQPKPGEEETKDQLLKRLKEYYDEAKKAIEPRHKKWKEQYSYFINTVIPKDRPYYKSDVRINYCNVVPNTKLPILTQNKPTVNFISFEQTDEANQRADIMSKLIGNALWNKLNIQDELDDTTLASSLYDGGIWKVGWDPSAEQGIGEVFANSLDVFKFLPDPQAKTVQDARYIIHIEPRTVKSLKRQYPDYASQISFDKGISDILYEDRATADRSTSVEYVTSTTKFKNERAYIKEYWTAPTEEDLTIMEKVGEKQEQVTEQMVDDNGQPVVDPTTGQPQMRTSVKVTDVMAPKYRGGRVITTINDQIIIDDKPNPYNHMKKPFVVQKMNRIPADFWGMGDIEQIIPLQNFLNHMFELCDDNATKTANVGYTLDPDMGKEAINKVVAKLDKPGSAKIAKAGQITPDVPPQMPNYIFNLINIAISQIGIVSGITEILQGRDAKHRTARGLERIFEAAISRIGQSTRLMENAITEVALLMAEVCKQFYNEPRQFALIGTAGPIGAMSVNEGDLAGEYDVSIDSGASLPKDKQSKADLMFELLQNHIFDMALSQDPIQKEIATTVLNTVEWPGREKLLNWQAPVQASPVPPSIGAPASGAGAPPLPPGGPQGMPPQLLQQLMAARGGAPQTPPQPPQMPPQASQAIQEMAQAAGVSPQQLVAMLSQARPTQ